MKKPQNTPNPKALANDKTTEYAVRPATEKLCFQRYQIHSKTNEPKPNQMTVHRKLANNRGQRTSRFVCSLCVTVAGLSDICNSHFRTTAFWNITVELTRRRESKHPPPRQAS